jgi:hypothetical protein
MLRPKSCPKCGRAYDERRAREYALGGPYYCSVPAPEQRCVHNVQGGNHLYDRCACGYELNIRPCIDANVIDTEVEVVEEERE